MKYTEFNDIGIPIFGLYSVVNVNGTKFCECLNPNCNSLYKHPRNTSWENTPVWGDEQIECMEMAGSFDTGYGVLCSDLIVIDVDARNGGLESYERLCKVVPSITQCSYIVASGSGGGSKHLYFKKPKDLDHKLSSHLDDYKGIDFKVSGYVVGEGSQHISGNKYVAICGEPSDIEEAPKDLVALLKKIEIEPYDGDLTELDNQGIAELLEYIPTSQIDGYEEWIKVGMAIYTASNGRAFAEWDNWNKTSIHYDREGLIVKWRSFNARESDYKLGTLIQMAQRNGYTIPLKMDNLADIECNIDWSKPRKKSIDLKNPPFLAGEITKWINSRSLYPRENLAVGASIQLIASAMGLNYRGYLNCTSNMIMFGIAGSGTGKESIIQSFDLMLSNAGLIEARHGAIISEQEIVRNLIDHQASFYLIDEIGEVLNKMQKAKKSGGTSHLEGVIGTLMSVYSKSNGIYAISNTHKKKFLDDLYKRKAKIDKKIEENEATPNDKNSLNIIQKQIDSLKKGIENPFLSMIGFATPVNFDNLLDSENADNGFFGRALILREYEDNPRAKENFEYINPKDDKVLHSLSEQLHLLYSSGVSSTTDRIQQQVEELIHLPCDEKMTQFLKQIQEEYYYLAEEHKEKSGLIAYIRRAFELVNKIAMVLSVSEGKYEREAIEWANEFVKRTLLAKLLVTTGNIESKNATGVMAKIQSKLDKETGMTARELQRKLGAKYKADDIKKVIDEMIEKGIVYEDESGKAKRYFLND